MVERPRSRGSNPAKGKIFFVFSGVQTCSGTNLASCWIDREFAFLVGKTAGTWCLLPRFNVVVRYECELSPLPLCAIMAWSGLALNSVWSGVSQFFTWGTPKITVRVATTRHQWKRNQIEDADGWCTEIIYKFRTRVPRDMSRAIGNLSRFRCFNIYSTISGRTRYCVLRNSVWKTLIWTVDCRCYYLYVGWPEFCVISLYRLLFDQNFALFLYIGYFSTRNLR